MTLNLLLIAISGWMFYAMPKGFFPQEDTGLIFGFAQADPDISFPGMSDRMEAVAKVIAADPDVASLGSSIGGTGGAGLNTGRVFIQLKPFDERTATADGIIARLRPKLAAVPGITVFLQSIQNIQVGGRLARTQYQYTLEDVNLDELNAWAPKMLAKLKTLPALQDVASDQQSGGVQLTIKINRDSAARLGVNVTTIQQTLYDAFGQPFITQLYGPLNTYHVVLEVAPRYQTDVSALPEFTCMAPGAPSSRSASSQPSNRPKRRLRSTIRASFRRSPSHSIWRPAIPSARLCRPSRRRRAEVGKPDTLQASFQGTAQEFQVSLSTQPLLIAAALFAVYVVLGILYESFVHPLTILLSLPSASVGALFFLYVFGFDLTMMAIIGLLMLIGIVKKNAIMMIDFALERLRVEHMPAEKAIHEAAVLRFRPIMMTTMSAIFVTLPIAAGIGAGADLRQPLGIAVVGGLIVSQALTLFTVPVTYLYMERFNEWAAEKFARVWRGQRASPAGA